jgi:NADH-quinone oxidoreductase subunit K
MSIELMLLAVNTNFIAFSHYLGDMLGQVFVFFILTVASRQGCYWSSNLGDLVQKQ